MARRIHVPTLRVGDIALDKAQTHHARDVLRLPSGTVVDLFDDAGATAVGVLQHQPSGESSVRIDVVNPPSIGSTLQWTIAAAVPKGDRADWMVEKLSELGATAFIPLATARSVVLPEGKNKRERWSRIATEAAKQSRRTGVMRIEELTPVDLLLKCRKLTASGALGELEPQRAGEGLLTPAWFLATEVAGAMPAADALAAARDISRLIVFIGPEGGWTREEVAAFAVADVHAVRLGKPILRIETAAIAAGAIISSCLR